jgi:hypothetical protein
MKQPQKKKERKKDFLKKMENGRRPEKIGR